MTDASPPPVDHCELSTYAELVEVIVNLRFLVREKRRRERLSQRAAAKVIGCTPMTISRFESGAEVDTHNLIYLIEWVGGLPGPDSEGREQRGDRFIGSVSAGPDFAESADQGGEVS